MIIFSFQNLNQLKYLLFQITELKYNSTRFILNKFYL